MNKMDMKNKPSKGFWYLYFLSLFILIIVIFKIDIKLEPILWLSLPFLNFGITYFIIIIHFVVDLIIEN